MMAMIKTTNVVKCNLSKLKITDHYHHLNSLESPDRSKHAAPSRTLIPAKPD